jgi:lipoprotein-anchoring transpeptidase ErfK/SrfK
MDKHDGAFWALSATDLWLNFRARVGHIIVDPGNHFLYSVQDARQALQYEVVVGKEGYGWSGVATVHDKKEWPDWYPTADILQRKPEIRQYMVQLQNGSGMHGGPDNPLGAPGAVPLAG